jgi:hypothetical protein
MNQIILGGPRVDAETKPELYCQIRDVFYPTATLQSDTSTVHDNGCKAQHRSSRFGLLCSRIRVGLVLCLVKCGVWLIDRSRSILVRVTHKLGRLRHKAIVWLLEETFEKRP